MQRKALSLIDLYRHLSADTLDLLKNFYSERDAREKQFEDLKAQAENAFESKTLSMDLFAEDWNASQFWVSSVVHSLRLSLSPVV